MEVNVNTDNTIQRHSGLDERVTTLVEEAISRLPERTHAILRAYRFDGTPRKEIAVNEGISVSAVEKHLHRAYKAIESVREEIDGADISSA